MKKKRYLMIVCLLFSSGYFINVEAAEGGSSSVGIEFYQKEPLPIQDPMPKIDSPSTGSKGEKQEPTGSLSFGGTNNQAQKGKQLPSTGSKSQANLSILGLALIGLVGMVHRKRGQHEAN